MHWPMQTAENSRAPHALLVDVQRACAAATVDTCRRAWCLATRGDDLIHSATAPLRRHESHGVHHHGAGAAQALSSEERRLIEAIVAKDLDLYARARVRFGEEVRAWERVHNAVMCRG